MLQKWRILLRWLIIVFNLLFWLMLAYGFRLSWQSNFLGSFAVAEDWKVEDLYDKALPVPVSQYGGSLATFFVGSVAIILLILTVPGIPGIELIARRGRKWVTAIRVILGFCLAVYLFGKSFDHGSSDPGHFLLDGLVCYQRYPSPSSQHSLVIEGYELLGELYHAHAYSDGPILRTDLGETGDDCR
ncbi:MAG TPA: hypothetical protein IGS53_27370 [Leptolyngbyaceae cyanobacterium M33_DOE_097]|uniref:Uncharacterized protein n=1 Tax=Oscillatoriales cyanobacterium SpSt-418 TaxID=2282169 RepID=A0A7C3KCF3_9CYAN|nr:hypothetical protein [Leptolyngbyaceae cyanobacterium M33_DOE_097]